MSLNTSHAYGGVLMFSGERILIFYDGVQFKCDTSSSLPHFKGTKTGRLYLTTHRVIFNNKKHEDQLQSFAVPFYCMKNVEVNQPIFGSNNISFEAKAEPGGNWDGTGHIKLWFTHGGAIEFGMTLLQSAKMAQSYTWQPPPAYTPPTEPYFAAPPPDYAPPTGPGYGFIPFQAFPEQPPPNSVFMTHAPPPYPGIDTSVRPYSGPQGVPYTGPQAPPYIPPYPANGMGPGSSCPPPYTPGGAPPFTNGPEKKAL